MTNIIEGMTEMALIFVELMIVLFMVILSLFIAISFYQNTTASFSQMADKFRSSLPDFS